MSETNYEEEYSYEEEPIEVQDTFRNEYEPEPTHTRSQQDVVVTKGDTLCADEETMDVYETRRILAKRIKKHVKPIVYKIEEEILDNCGNVIEVIVQELDESNLRMVERTSSVHQKPVKVQSTPEPISKPQTKVKHIKRKISDLNPDWITHNVTQVRRYSNGGCLEERY